MRILILGGTRFVGRHLAAEAIDRGHEVTLFNRGTRNVPFAKVESIVGDVSQGQGGPAPRERREVRPGAPGTYPERRP